MKCTFCRRNQADFRSKGGSVIVLACAACVWSAEVRQKPLNYEFVSLPVKKEEKNGQRSPRIH